tara:strand:- start:2490 stop:3665 length:1176 start_codon:yes stop_codon:yes gene_type:complete
MSDQTELNAKPLHPQTSNALTSNDHGDLDSILARAHALPVDKVSFLRPEAALLELAQAYGIKSTSRLAYLPQPAVYPVHDWPDSSPFKSAAPDISLAYLFIDRDVLLRESRQAKDEIHGAMWKLLGRKIQALSFVDAAAVLSSDHLTEMAKLAVWVVEKNVQFTKSGMTIWCSKDVKGIPPKRRILRNCASFAFIRRTMFYEARLKRKSLAAYHQEVCTLLEQTGFPNDWNVQHAFEQIEALLHQEYSRIEDAWTENVELQWTCDPIAIEAVSTPIIDPDSIDCITCRDTLTPPGVRTPCNHTFCRSCLETWIHACEKASHTCPYCRAELFKKPDYMYKEPKVVINYQQELKQCDMLQKDMKLVEKSCKLFEAELELQKKFERETADIAVE